MSFFNKIFGGGEKKTQTKAPPPPQPPADDEGKKKIQMQGAMVKLDQQIRSFQDQQKKLENKSNMLRAKAKQFIEQGKKVQARKYAQQSKRVQKQMENYALRRKVLVDKKFQLDQASMNKQTIGALQSADIHMKDQQKYAEKLQQMIFAGQQSKMQQDQINDKLRDLVNGQDEQEQVDDMLNELMGQINRQKKQKMQVPGKKIEVNVPSQKNKPVVERDEIEDMLNAL